MPTPTITSTATTAPPTATTGRSHGDWRTPANRAATDRNARLVAYGDLQSLLADAAPALFLYELHYEYAVSSRVSGVQLNQTVDPAARFEYVTEWSLATG